MHTTRAEVSHLYGVIVVHLLLDTQSPLNRVRQDLIRNETGCSRAGMRLAQITSGRPRTRLSSALRKERHRKPRWEIFGVDGGAELPRISCTAGVIENNVISHSKTSPDRSCP